MYKIIALLLFLGVFQCEKTNVKTEESIEGEWKYVGTFSHLANYACYVCPEFDFAKSIYTVNFNRDNTYSTKINLLIGKGEYTTSVEKSNSIGKTGTFENLNLEILNKPYETEADSKFKTMFSESSTFNITYKSSNQTYDLLTLGSNNDEYLLFARK